MPNNQRIVIQLQVRYNRYQYESNLSKSILSSQITKVVSQRVLDTSTSKGLPQVELSKIQNGIIRGVGNVTNLATWINTL
jgi:hypothetical protein